MDRTTTGAGAAPEQPTLADDLLIDVEEDAAPTVMSASPGLLGLALVLVAFNLRPALSSVAPVLAELVRDTGITATMASVLTTLPVLCLGIFGLLAPGLARRHGGERVVLVTMLVLAAGIGLRAVPDFAAQVAAAIAAGAGIGVIGALLPGIVKRDFPNHPALMTGVYSMGLCAGASAAAGATLPLAHLFGGSWSLALGFWAVPALVGAAAWGALALSGPAGGPRPPSSSSAADGRLWSDRLAWQVTLFMGLQSSLAYIVFGWLAVMLRDRGVAPVTAGLEVSVSILAQVAAALIAPVLATRRPSQSLAVAIVLSMSLAGMMGLLYAPLGTLWGWAVLLGIGQGGTFALALTVIVLRAGDPHTAARLSSMAQSVGYALAALGPLASGLLHDWTHGWTAVGILFAAITAAATGFGVAAGRNRHVLA